MGQLKLSVRTWQLQKVGSAALTAPLRRLERQGADVLVREDTRVGRIALDRVPGAAVTAGREVGEASLGAAASPLDRRLGGRNRLEWQRLVVVVVLGAGQVAGRLATAPPTRH